MSQKKMEAYKEYKKNKEQILKREKRTRKIEFAIIIAVCCVFVGWFGFSIYDSVTHKPVDPTAAVAPTEIDMNAYSDYVDGLQTTFTS